MVFGRIKRIFLGEPLSNQALEEEKISKWKALAVLSSDALSSTAYATEEILLALVAFSSLGPAIFGWSVPVALAITALLVIVTLSYRQTISVYRNGGGAYVVAKENLGIYAGLFAGASLLIDYVLTVAVSVAAGVSAITSAFPALLGHRVALAGLIVLLITIMNLRGIRESATVFALPTYAFIVSVFLLLIAGTFQLVWGSVTPLQPVIPNELPDLAVLVILKAFSSGCTALTGIEAISNAVPAFQPPQHKNAKTTMTWMTTILIIMFLGITFLARELGVAPHDQETVLSQIARQVFGSGLFYYLVQFTTAMILVLAANTAYNGFPWLAAILAKDRYLPRQLAMLGDRLVFSNSIIGLSAAAIILLIMFDAQPHKLIPLYATGVFIGFTLSQAGMVRHHYKNRQKGWMRALVINAIGAVTTGVVVLVIVRSKFASGAWVVILLIPVFIMCFKRIYKHYIDVGKELSLIGVAAPGKLEPYKHTVIIPISGIHRGVIDALKYAISISDDVRACYVELDSSQTPRMLEEWNKWAHEIPFIILKSPYRSVIRPLLDYIDDVEQTAHRDMITIIIPEFVTAKWWHQVLHNQTAFLIRAALLFRKGKVVTSVRYHLKHT